ncbi:MAG: flagellin lysine-N-methylase [Terracidiphilus sp.]|nr:flagellin lysine-N-methylase [Terracidiphilus sp.]
MSPATPRISYAGRFHCIGAACEDDCCTGWTVPVDPQTFERFHRLPPSPLKDELLVSIEQKTPPTPHFATMRLDAAHHCPMLASSGLCRLQLAHGESILPETCREFPRYRQRLNGQTETALALSCPEAARLVLLAPNLLTDGSYPAAPNMQEEARTPLQAWAGQIRALVLWLVSGNRQYPLWQRLFLLRLFCHRLDGLCTRQSEHQTPALIARFETSVRTGALRTTLDRLPASTEAQLDLVLQLAGLLLHQSNVTPRFAACVQAFTSGIGNGPGATLASLARGYDEARQQWFEPFLAQHPHMLENWFVNAIVRHRFPFGWQSKEELAPASAVEEFDGLAANFALIRGLLIGVAGFHRERFSAGHAVHTVQSASKHFEHHPAFLSRVHMLLRESGQANARGIALLLGEAFPARPLSPQPFAPQPMAAQHAPSPIPLEAARRQ